MKFSEFIKRVFTHNVPLKLLAIVVAAACVIVMQIIVKMP